MYKIRYAIFGLTKEHNILGACFIDMEFALTDNVDIKIFGDLFLNHSYFFSLKFFSTVFEIIKESY